MAFIPDDELDDIRAVTDSALPEWVSIQRDTLVSDGGGDFARTWTTNRRVHARIGRAQVGDRMLEAETLARDAVVDFPHWIVTLPWSDPVTTEERVVTDNGRVLNIISTDRAHSFQVHVRCLCAEAR